MGKISAQQKKEKKEKKAKAAAKKKANTDVAAAAGKIGTREEAVSFYAKLKRPKYVSKRDSENMRKYGLTQRAYQIMYDRTGGACYMCGKKLGLYDRWTYVEHNHSTSAINGVSCSTCNTSKGRLENKTPAELARLAAWA